MKPILLAGLLMLAAAPLALAHAEGNGPAFPGLQTPDVAVSTGIGNSRQATDTIEHSSVEPEGGLNETLPAKQGLTLAQERQRAHTWAVLNSNTID